MGLPATNNDFYNIPHIIGFDNVEDEDNSLVASHCKPKILVVAVGGGGGNAVNYMIRSGMKGFDTVAMNTDSADIANSLAAKTFLLGEELTRGLGAGSTPEVGRLAARASREEIRSAIAGHDMVYIAACMGGGTGTGAAPVVAGVARDLGVLTVAVVTRPFTFEGRKKSRLANEGIEKLRKFVDALIVIDNDRIIASSQKKTTFADALTTSDAILASAVGGVSDLISNSSYINVDFADVRAILKNSGDALMGIGTASGGNSLQKATRQAMADIIASPVPCVANGAILNIVCRERASLAQIAEASDLVQDYLHEDAQFVLGHIDNVESLDCEAKVTVILSGITAVAE